MSHAPGVSLLCSCLLISALRVVAWVLVTTGLADLSVTFGKPATGGWHIEIFPTLVLTFTMAHVIAVVFRSHLNTALSPFLWGSFSCLRYLPRPGSSAWW